MLLVIGYQNLIEMPHLKTQLGSLNSPEVLPTVSMVGGVSRADKLPSADVKPGKPVLLTVDIPTDDRYSSYQVSLLDSAGKPAWKCALAAHRDYQGRQLDTPPVVGRLWLNGPPACADCLARAIAHAPAPKNDKDNMTLHRPR